MNENIRLAQFFASKWARTFGEDEAFSLALQGLQAAAESYDPSKGTKEDPMPFGTHASCCIRNMLCASYKRANAKKRGRGIAHVSLDAPVGDEDSQTFGDLISDPRARDVTESLAARDMMEKALALLDERSSEIIRMRFGLDGEKPATLEEIGEVFGLTRERIRQIENLALELIAEKNSIKRTVRRRAVFKQTPSQTVAATRDDFFVPENSAPPVPRRIQKARAYRAANREKIRIYFRSWLEKNRARVAEQRRQYQSRNADRIKAWSREWYKSHRESIRLRNKQAYEDNPEPARERARRWRSENPDRAREVKARFREANREKLSRAEKARIDRLMPYYVRAQLFRRHGGKRPIDSFTFEEIQTYREHLIRKRSKIGIPVCPKCGKPGRKDGHFRPSGNQRYSCLNCRLVFGVGNKASPHRGKKRESKSGAFLSHPL